MNTRILVSLVTVFAFVAMLFSSCGLTGYKVKDGKVYYDTWNEAHGHVSTCMEEADAESFEILDNGYAKDKAHAWFEANLLEGANASSFRSLGEFYATDDKAVWHIGDRVNVADPQSFKPKTYYLGEDKTDYYWFGNPIHVADKASFQLLGDANDGIDTYWAKDKKYAYFLRSIEDIDPSECRVAIRDYDSFHPIVGESRESNEYAADKYQVYYCETIVPGADPSTFKEVGYEIGQDKNRVYYQNRPTTIKSYSTLTPVGRFYKTKTAVYDQELNAISGADAATFQHIEDFWYKDKNNAYYNAIIIPEADMSTFGPVTQYYFDGSEVTGTATSSDYAKDSKHVYHCNTIVPGADPATFFAVDCSDAESWTVFDKNNYYEGVETPGIKAFRKKMMK